MLVQRFEFRGREIGGDARQFFGRQLQSARSLDFVEFARHAFAHFLGADRVDQDFDALFVDVVAAAVLIVDAQHRFQISQDIFARHELGHHMCNIRRASHAAAGMNAITGFSRRVLHDLHSHIVDI